MNYILEFFKQYGFEFLSTILLGVISFIGIRVRSIYEDRVKDKTKRQVVKDCVKMVEQVYKDIHGKEKLEKAKESILIMLNEKGIVISELEMDVLIEAAVQEINETKEIIFADEAGEG